MDSRPGVRKISAILRRVLHRFDTVPVVAWSFVALYALYAWVFQVVGHSDFARRLLLGTIVVFVYGSIALASTLVSGRMRALGMVIVGVMGASLTGPIVLSHVAKLGLQGSGITGILAVAGSIVLLCIGGTRLVRMARTVPRKLLAVPVAFDPATVRDLPAGQCCVRHECGAP